MIDEDAAAYAMIEANVATARLLESRQAKREPEAVMSLETALECRRKADEIASRLRSRALSWQEGPHGS